MTDNIEKVCKQLRLAVYILCSDDFSDDIFDFNEVYEIAQHHLETIALLNLERILENQNKNISDFYSYPFL